MLRGGLSLLVGEGDKVRSIFAFLAGAALKNVSNGADLLLLVAALVRFCCLGFCRWEASDCLKDTWEDLIGD